MAQTLDFAVSSEYSYDAKSGRFRYSSGASKGKFAPREAVLELTRRSIARQSENLIELGDSLSNDSLSLRDFQRQSAELLRQIHVSSAVLGRGGSDRMTSEDWLKIARTLKVQYTDGKDPESGRRFGLKWLSEEIKEGKVTAGQLRSRLRLYANSGGLTYWDMWRRSEVDGDRPYAVRELGQAEHCNDCPKLAAQKPQPILDILLPGQGCECGTNCKCRLRALTLEEAIARGLKDPRPAAQRKRELDAIERLGFGRRKRSSNFEEEFGFAEIEVSDRAILEQIRNDLEARIGRVDRVYGVSVTDEDIFYGKAQKKLNATRSEIFSFKIDPDGGRITYKMDNADEMLKYGEADEAWNETYEFAAKTRRADRKLNCKPGNMQCGGKCQNGKMGCPSQMLEEERKAYKAAARKARGGSKGEDVLQGFNKSLAELSDLDLEKAARYAESSSFDAARGGDRVLSKIYELKGFHQKPQILSSAEIDRLEKAGSEIVYRGVERNTATVINSYIESPYHYAGLGFSGSGTYAANLSRAKSYTQDGTVIRMALLPSARVAKMSDLRRELAFDRRALRGRLDEETIKTLLGQGTDKSESPDTQNNFGRYAALRGYDAIDLGAGTYVLLNRGAIGIQKDPFPVNFEEFSFNELFDYR